MHTIVIVDVKETIMNRRSALFLIDLIVQFMILTIACCFAGISLLLFYGTLRSFGNTIIGTALSCFLFPIAIFFDYVTVGFSLVAYYGFRSKYYEWFGDEEMSFKYWGKAIDTIGCLGGW